MNGAHFVDELFVQWADPGDQLHRHRDRAQGVSQVVREHAQKKTPRNIELL